jgi:hypothetical protein
MVSGGRLYACLAFLDVHNASVVRFSNSSLSSLTFFGAKSGSQSSPCLCIAYVIVAFVMDGSERCSGFRFQFDGVFVLTFKG